MRAKRLTFIIVCVLCAPFALYLLLPLAGLLAQVSVRQFATYVCCPTVAQALRVSLYTTLISTVLAILLGTPVAYLLSHHRFRGREVVDTLVDLPLVLPPSAAGLALLMAYGNSGLGPYLERLGIGRIPLTMTAVVMAQLFVASPFFIRQARTGFEGVHNNLKLASLTLGASPAKTFMSVTIPLSSRALIAGTTMTWARALGEFGATLVFAGQWQGRTETMPIAIYSSFSSNTPAAIALAATLVCVSFIVLVTAKMLLGRTATVA